MKTFRPLVLESDLIQEKYLSPRALALCEKLNIHCIDDLKRFATLDEFTSVAGSDSDAAVSLYLLGDYYYFSRNGQMPYNLNDYPELRQLLIHHLTPIYKDLVQEKLKKRANLYFRVFPTAEAFIDCIFQHPFKAFALDNKVKKDHYSYFWAVTMDLIDELKNYLDEDHDEEGEESSYNKKLYFDLWARLHQCCYSMFLWLRDREVAHSNLMFLPTMSCFMLCKGTSSPRLRQMIECLNLNYENVYYYSVFLKWYMVDKTFSEKQEDESLTQGESSTQNDNSSENESSTQDESSSENESSSEDDGSSNELYLEFEKHFGLILTLWDFCFKTFEGMEID